MARMRNRYNQKARQSQKKKTVIIEPDSNQALVDPKALGADTSKYDEANQLVLPSKKRKTVTKSESAPGGKLLSRKQRKKLEKIVERREKKSNRAELLEELQKHQLPPEKYAQLTPLVKIQTEGLKKLFSEIDKGDFEKRAVNDEIEIKKPVKPKSSIKGSNKLKYRSWSGRFGDVQKNGTMKKEKDPMVLGLDEESSSEDDSDSDVEVKVEAEEDSDKRTNEEKTSMEVEQEENEGDEGVTMDEGDQTKDSSSTDKYSTKETSTETTEEETVATTEIEQENEKPDVEMIAFKVRQPKRFVQVNRKPEIEAVRAKLPIIPEEQIIMESITENAVTVLAGETGSGKTTQVPQFLYEAGYATDGKIIGITEPRRVAAITMSYRVAEELNLSREIVSYQIRFEGNVNPKTKIKFMTDGVLLKEMEKDFLLSKYSAICIDEAHERSLYTDILIGLLSRCVKIRQKRKDPLKLIIMSATMRVEDFKENPKLFKTPPALIHVPTRQFPVQIHFNKVTPENYIVAAYRKAVQIHRKLPPGGILIFLTGRQEVMTVVAKLRKAFPNRGKLVKDDTEKEESIEKDLRKKGKKKRGSQNKNQINLRTFDLDQIKGLPLKSGEDEEDEAEENSDMEHDYDSGEELDYDETDVSTNQWHVEREASDEPLYVLPLYSMLRNDEQQKVFEPPPEDHRLCVVATNVAETSLTIPSIRYVVDAGKVKTKEWDKLTGVQQFNVTWCSKASAEQRAGRAGRTGPGHCYRLYSSAVFDSEFQQYSPPEIMLRPVDDMMLFMKSIGIDRVQNFPYPTHPGDKQLISAEQTLIYLGALERLKKEVNKKGTVKGTDTSKITDLGKTMSHFPLSPRFSKMLALSFHHSVVEYAIALVAALTVQEVFLDAGLSDSSKDSKSSWAKLRRQWAGSGSHLLLGDCMVLLRAVGAFEYEKGSADFCQKAGLRFKAMQEIRKLRRQLTLEVNMMVPSGQELPLNPHMKPPSEDEAEIMRQILLGGMPDRVARKIHESELKEDEDKRKFKYAYRCGELEDPVIMHPFSALRSTLPEWVVYQEIFESNEKMYVRGITAIEPTWIPLFCKPLCHMGSPLPDPPPYFDSERGIIKCSVKVTYGRQGWTLPEHEIEFPFSLEKFKLFAQFFLEGLVCPKLVKWKTHLLSLPITMTKPWARLQPRTQTFLNALTSKKICDKAGLLKMWEDDKNYLLEQYLEWLPIEHHVQVSSIWPPK